MGEKELHFNAVRLLGVRLMAHCESLGHDRMVNWLGTQFDTNGISVQTYETNLTRSGSLSNKDLSHL